MLTQIFQLMDLTFRCDTNKVKAFTISLFVMYCQNYWVVQLPFNCGYSLVLHKPTPTIPSPRSNTLGPPLHWWGGTFPVWRHKCHEIHGSLMTCELTSDILLKFDMFNAIFSTKNNLCWNDINKFLCYRLPLLIAIIRQRWKTNGKVNTDRL